MLLLHLNPIYLILFGFLTGISVYFIFPEKMKLKFDNQKNKMEEDNE